MRNFKNNVQFYLNLRNNIREEEEAEEGGEEAASCKTCKCCGKKDCKCDKSVFTKTKGGDDDDDNKSVSTGTVGGDDDEDGKHYSCKTDLDKIDAMADEDARDNKKKAKAELEKLYARRKNATCKTVKEHLMHLSGN